MDALVAGLFKFTTWPRLEDNQSDFEKGTTITHPVTFSSLEPPNRRMKSETKALSKNHLLNNEAFELCQTVMVDA